MKTNILLFDQFLTERGLQFQSVIIGGAALNVMGITDRRTKDVDCLTPRIPDSVKQASEEFRINCPELHLAENWLNNGPMSLTNDLPDGWQERLVSLFEGTAIHLQTLGRADLLLTKFFALCDRQQDLDDCIALTPTVQELDQSLEWLYERDGNPFWPDNVRTSLKKLAKELGYEYLPTHD